MTDTTNITELRPSPAKGEVVTRVVKDRTATERKRRSRANKQNVPRKPQHRDTLVTMPGHSVSVPVTPVIRPARIDVAAYTAAIGLASVAALFSIKGMAQLVPGTPILIVAMATMMEASKLVTVGLSAVKVGGDSENPLFDLSGLSDQELAFLRRTVLKATPVDPGYRSGDRRAS